MEFYLFCVLFLSFLNSIIANVNDHVSVRLFDVTNTLRGAPNDELQVFLRGLLGDADDVLPSPIGSLEDSTKGGRLGDEEKPRRLSEDKKVEVNSHGWEEVTFVGTDQVRGGG